MAFGLKVAYGTRRFHLNYLKKLLSDQYQMPSIDKLAEKNSVYDKIITTLSIDVNKCCYSRGISSSSN